MTTVREIVNGALAHFGLQGFDAATLTASTATAGEVVIDALRLVGVHAFDVATADASTATVLDVITNALRTLTVVGAEATPSAADAADALASLNDMFFGWAAAGVDVSPTVLTLADTFPLAAAFQGGVTALLAVRLAESYGMSAPQIATASSQNGWAALQAAYVTVPQALAALNDMLAEWVVDGVDVGYATALGMTDTVPVDQPFVAGVKALLALRLAENLQDTGKPVPSVAQNTGAKAWLRLQIGYKYIPEAVTALNDMLAGWAAVGVDVAHTAFAIGDDFPLADSLASAVKAMLAVRIAAGLGQEISAQLAASAASGWTAIQAAYIDVPDAQFDSALLKMPSLAGNYSGVY